MQYLYMPKHKHFQYKIPVPTSQEQKYCAKYKEVNLQYKEPSHKI